MLSTTLRETNTLRGPTRLPRRPASLASAAFLWTAGSRRVTHDVRPPGHATLRHARRHPIAPGEIDLYTGRTIARAHSLTTRLPQIEAPPDPDRTR